MSCGKSGLLLALQMTSVPVGFVIGHEHFKTRKAAHRQHKEELAKKKALEAEAERKKEKEERKGLEDQITSLRSMLLAAYGIPASNDPTTTPNTLSKPPGPEPDIIDMWLSIDFESDDH